MTHPGDGDVPDDGRRKRRRRRRGRRTKNKATGANGVPVADAPGTANDDAPAPNVKKGESSRGGAAGQAAASGRRKSRSRRRKSGTRASGAHGNPPTGNVPTGNVPTGHVPTGHVPSGNAQVKRAGSARPSGTSRHAETNRGIDVPAIATDSTSPAAALRSAAPSASSSEADALAARRARADRETSAGGIVYRVQNGVALFLIIRDSYRNWGFPKGHLEGEELPDEAAIREVQEETGLVELQLDGVIETIDWFFRFRGRLVHKVCHFYLMRTESTRTVPQREEGITACRWARFEEASRLISYANARSVLSRANAMVLAGSGELADVGPHAGANAGANTHPHTSTNAADAARPTR